MRERIPTLQANPAMKLIRTERCLAGAEVCYVGQAVAVVIAVAARWRKTPPRW